MKRADPQQPGSFPAGLDSAVQVRRDSLVFGSFRPFPCR